MPDFEGIDMMQEDLTPNRIYVDIDGAKRSDIDGMLSIFNQAFLLENPKLPQLMYSNDPSDEALHYVVKDILDANLGSQHCKFMVAYDASERRQIESECECEHPEIGLEHSLHSEIDMNENKDSESDMENLTLGWISLGVVPHGVTTNAYVASELTTYACLKVLDDQAQARGEDHLSMRDPRVRLLYELELQSRNGQARDLFGPHLIVNALVFWPGAHEDTTWETTSKLLGWAINFADRRNMPVWTQVPANQMEYFHQAGFREVRSFMLNLNDYLPPRSTRYLGATHEWVQMMYGVASGAPRARSVSPRRAGGRHRRLSV